MVAEVSSLPPSRQMSRGISRGGLIRPGSTDMTYSYDEILRQATPRVANTLKLPPLDAKALAEKVAHRSIAGQKMARSASMRRVRREPVAPEAFVRPPMRRANTYGPIRSMAVRDSEKSQPVEPQGGKESGGLLKNPFSHPLKEMSPNVIINAPPTTQQKLQPIGTPAPPPGGKPPQAPHRISRTVSVGFPAKEPLPKPLMRSNTTPENQQEDLTLAQPSQQKMPLSEGYTGEQDAQGRPHGKGTLVYKNGDFFEGTFANGKFLHGSFNFAQGHKYEGAYSDGRYDGSGVFAYANGDVYEGGFKGGRQCGRGEHRYANGNRYSGDWVQGERNGEGTFTFADGARYEGEWRGGKKEGRGMFRFGNGNVYEGEYKNGQRHGQGTFSQPDGMQYVGGWAQGKKHGRGKHTYANGDVFEGQFENGLKSGYGVHRYHDGNLYEGEWAGDVQNGRGKMTFFDGSVYEGEYVDARTSGRHEYADGSVYEGEWAGRRKNGEGVRRYANGDVYEGMWKFDEREGHGKLEVAATGEVKEGEWLEDEFVGERPEGREGEVAAEEAAA